MLTKGGFNRSQGSFQPHTQSSMSYLNRTPNKIVVPQSVSSHSVNLTEEGQPSARQRVLKQSRSSNEKTFLVRDLSHNVLKLVPGSSHSRSKPQIPKQGSNSGGGHVSQRTANNCSTRESEVSSYLLKRKSEHSKDQIYTSHERMNAQLKADNQNLFQELKDKERMLYQQSQKMKAHRSEIEKLWKVYSQILPILHNISHVSKTKVLQRQDVIFGA